MVRLVCVRNVLIYIYAWHEHMLPSSEKASIAGEYFDAKSVGDIALKPRFAKLNGNKVNLFTVSY